MFRYIFHISLILLCSCSSHNRDEKDRISQEYCENPPNDSLGLNQSITYKMAQEIIEDYNLIGKPLDSIIKYLGNHYNGTIGYDIGSICSENGEIYDGSRSIYILPIKNGRLSADDFTVRILQ